MAAQQRRRTRMHVVVRKYTAGPEVVEEARPKLQHLEQTMRQTPGFVAYYFIQTDEGLATITITEDEAGTQESMSRAANWVQQNLPNSGLGAPEVIRGETLLNATR
jgi:quinol monooxygenase YgiN